MSISEAPLKGFGEVRTGPDLWAGRMRSMGNAWDMLNRIRGDVRDNPEGQIDPTEGFAVDNGEYILSLHRALAAGPIKPTPATYGNNGHTVQEMPYWELGPSNPDSLKKLDIGEDRYVMYGRFADFPVGHRALATDIAARVYTHTLLDLPQRAAKLPPRPHNPDYAKDWLHGQRMLFMLTSMQEVRPGQFACIAYGKSNGREYMLGSVGGAPGIGEREVIHTVGNDGTEAKPPSSIPSNFALRFPISPEGMVTLRGIREEQCFEPTRLWKSPIPRSLGIETSDIAVALYSTIFDAANDVGGGIFTHAIFNTKPALHEMLKKLGFKVITLANLAKPTPGILATVHGAYYSKFYEGEASPVVQCLEVPSALQTGWNLQESFNNLDWLNI
ncbi:MAG: hypothetical protein U0525_06110 [Patescibacteria group bacterium]